MQREKREVREDLGERIERKVGGGKKEYKIWYLTACSTSPHLKGNIKFSNVSIFRD